MKTCSKCKTSKSLEAFPRNVAKKDGRGTACLECQRLYTRSHYNGNKQYYVDKARRNDIGYKAQAREYIVEYFKTHPCVDCGESDMTVLEFDHRDGVDKSCGISALVRGQAKLDRLIAEIAKCDVRCCNCHRRRTAKQFGWWNASLA